MTYEIIVRLKPEWYQKLLDQARPGSPAECCLKNSVYQPSPRPGENEHVLRCDETNIGHLATLADIACPEAIPVLLSAYREAKNNKDSRH